MTDPKICPFEVKLGDYGQCEAHDLIQTDDDAVDVRCPRQGRRIAERSSCGGIRWRIVCALHGLASAMEVN